MSTRSISEPKGFQQATAEAALATLTRLEGPKRFLVADEVGLGKTVVARTVIREMMKGRRSPLVVFYFASNLNIAHQNRAKLLELLPGETQQILAAASADRLTLAANPARRPKHERLHLYTLTPDTSVPLYRRRGGFGRMEERALIFRLLSGRFPSLDTTWFSNKCRGSQAGVNGWEWALQQHDRIQGIRELQDAFFKALECGQLNIPRVDAESIASAAETQRPSRLMGSLRTALALAVLRNVQPHLIIFDEFQKFRDLLIEPRKKSKSPTLPLDPLTLALRGEERHQDPAVLLLSATPYRLYTSRQDETAGVSHYKEFLELTCFLFGSNSEVPAKVEADLREFGDHMRAKEPDFAQLDLLRNRIQKRLRPVVSRTERPNMLLTPADGASTHPHSEIRPEDLRVFKHWVARLKAAPPRQRRKVDLLSFAVPYWLSVPLPIQMLGRHYVAWKSADRRKHPRQEPGLRNSQRNRLEAPKVWPHPQFRELRKLASASRLALPWVGPSLPWWELGGPWVAPGAAGGKLLLFSRFKAVPPAIASLLSFDLESSLARRLRYNNRTSGQLRPLYVRAGEAQPLQLKANRPTLPALFFPSPTLIASTDPRRDHPSTLAEVRKSMRRQIGELRKRLGVKLIKRGGCRPLWKLLAALEFKRASDKSFGDLPSWPDLREHWLNAAAGQEDAMRKVFSRWDRCARAGLESITQSEVAALADFALSGPGVALGRALYRFDPTCISNERFEDLLSASWNGLRPYLNRSLFHAALTRPGQAYTKAIPEAVVSGNLESVLDEHLWISSQLDADAIQRFTLNLRKVLGLREGRHQVHEPGHDGNRRFLLRCHAAMPFANAKVTDPSTGREDRLRTDDLRKAFNSPFWPHVLATTSLGQEGLDFHVWCRQLLHWDLCSSPLDIEQREGRIQRFGGLSVRSALAKTLGPQTLHQDESNKSPWLILASHAGENYKHDTSGLSPWWSCQGEKIDRMFVVLPQSRQTARFDELSKQRWLYRLALGQPHQQDFIESVSQHPDDGRHQFALCLSAWQNGTAESLGPLPPQTRRKVSQPKSQL